MLSAAITIPGGVDGVWTLVAVPGSLVLAGIGGAIGILLTRRERSRHPDEDDA